MKRKRYLTLLGSVLFLALFPGSAVCLGEDGSTEHALTEAVSEASKGNVAQQPTEAVSGAPEGNVAQQPTEPSSEASSDREVVRVAFPEQEGMSYIGRSGKITGYNYDYLEKFSEYTGWKMEYVAYPSDDGNEAVMTAMQDLMDGKVDLMGPLLKNDYTEENFEFPENSYGTVYTTLCALTSSSLHENNIQNVKLLKVGLWTQAETRNAEVLSFLDSNSLPYEITYYDSSDEQYQALLDGAVDLISSVSLSPFPNTKIIERFAPRPYYFAATKEKTELIHELNDAILKIDYVQPTLQDSLFTRYFQNSEDSFVFSDAEAAELAQLNTLKVLCIDYDAPYVYQENGEAKGMLISILDDFAEKIGSTVEYTFCESRDEADGVMDGFDLLIGFPFTSDYCAERGFVRSEPIIESGLSYVQDSDRSTRNTIAIVKGVEDLVDTSSFQNVILYDTARECISAIDAGRADAAAGDRSMMEYYIYESGSHLTTTLISGETQKVGIAVSKECGTKLMEILNRYIYSLSDLQKTAYLSAGNGHANSLLLLRYIRQNPAQATVIVVVITAVIATGIFMMLYAKQMNRKNEELRAANEVKSKFLTRMSHDIRTPMNGILGMLDISDQFLENPQQLKRYHLKIHTAAEYLLSLINDVLDMNRMEETDTLPMENSVDLRALMEECSDLLRVKASEKHVSVTVVKTAEVFAPPRVFAPERELKRVFMNLFGNAVKYSRANGTVDVTARVLEQKEETVTCEFSVRDYGIGMSREFQEKLFEPFAQEHGGARSEYSGTGLGLSIAKRIIDCMDGTIRVESEENIGTTVTWTLTFPIDRTCHAEQPSKPEEQKNVLTGLRILAAEDNALNAEILQFMLEEAGAEVKLVGNGLQEVLAFEKSEAGAFDVILTDVMMPVLSGYEACEKIRAMDRPDAKTIPIIGISANVFAEDIEQGMQAGMDSYVTKPIDPEYLKESIKRILDEKKNKK